MLDPLVLQNQLQNAFQTVFNNAAKAAVLATFPAASNAGEEYAKSFADTFSEVVSLPLAQVMANAIDSYIKNISITGTIITVGSPTTQTAKIITSPTPVSNGKIPNTLGIL